MIQLSNGHSFEYMAASGALAYDGRGWPWEYPLQWLGLLDPKLFTVVTKTLTWIPREGNLRWWEPWSCVRLLDGGVVNAVGLTNPGFQWWLYKVAPKIEKCEIPLVVSLLGTPMCLLKMTRQLREVPILGIEINASCPNIAEREKWGPQYLIESCVAVRHACDHPIILKVSADQWTMMEEVLCGIGGVVEALSVNSVPWKLAFPGVESPLARLGGGGVSGQVAQGYTWDMVRRLSGMSDIPVIGPSVWEFEDIARLRKIGAKAISFGSIFLRYPWRPTSYVRRDNRERRG